ncbi:unnamed protein product [Caenorhabditis brenneri]
MSRTFRLLYLPYCAIKVVLDHFKPRDILLFSICSKKTKNLVKSSKFKAKNGTLVLSIGVSSNSLSIERSKFRFNLIRVFETSMLPENRTLPIGRIGSFAVPMELHSTGFLDTYWENRRVGIQEAGNYGIEIFQKPIHQLVLGTEISKDDPRWALNWIYSIQPSLPMCFFSEVCQMDDDEIAYLLNTCRVTEKFYCLLKSTDSFTYREPIPFDLDVVMIRPSKWITQEHLLSMNCKWIGLVDSRLTSQDFNLFLKHFASGGCSKLKEIRIIMETNLDYDIALESFERTNETKNRRYINKDGMIFPVRSSLHIQFNDVAATVLSNISTPKEFWMVIWPDWQGNPY